MQTRKMKKKKQNKTEKNKTQVNNWIAINNEGDSTVAKKMSLIQHSFYSLMRILSRPKKMAFNIIVNEFKQRFKYQLFVSAKTRF